LRSPAINSDIAPKKFFVEPQRLNHSAGGAFVIVVAALTSVAVLAIGTPPPLVELRLRLSAVQLRNAD
jgi:hypothetical protein